MNLLRYLDPRNTPSSFKHEEPLPILKEEVLQTIALSSLLFGLFALFIRIPELLQTQEWVYIAIYCGAFVYCITITFFRNFSFKFRAYGVIIIFYLLGLAALIQRGLAGSGMIFLFGFAIVSTILLGWRSGIVSVILSVFSLLLLGAGMRNGSIATPQIDTNTITGNAPEWISGTIIFGLLGVLTTISLATLILGVMESLKKQKNLTLDLRRERASLEKRVEERTQDVQRRLTQIRTAAEINQAISGMLEQQMLLQNVVDLIQKGFNTYYAGVFLLDKKRLYAQLKAGTGEAGHTMVSNAHKLAVNETSMIGWTTLNARARIALDVGEDAVRFNNPLLPLTRSEMALPIIIKGRVIGALTIQSTEPNAFDQDDILVLRGIMDGLAIALENAQLFQSTQESLIEVQSLQRQYIQTSWAKVTGETGELNYTYQDPLQSRQNVESTHQISVPLTLRDEVIGKFTLETDKPSLSPEEMDFIEAITNQTSLALENARLVEETQRQAWQEQLLNQMTSKFSQSFDIDMILKNTVTELGQLPNVSEVSVILTSPDEQNFGKDQTDNQNQLYDN